MGRTLLLSAAFICCLAACNKADETTSSEDMLRSGTWRRTAMKTAHRNPSGTIDITDSYPLLEECIKDNTLEFKTAYTGVEHRNNKCSPGDADNANFTWEIYNSGKGIRIYNAAETFGDIDVNAEILNLSETQISMRYKIILQDASQTIPTDTITVTDVFRR